MTGKVVTELADREAKATILFEKAPPVFFLDTRRFGTLDLLPNTSVESYFQSKGIGPEPWPEKRDGQWWEQQLKGLRGAIKPSLMKQERVAGLGNIMASEILWAARVDPGKNVPDLSSDEWTAIAEAAYEVISRVIAVEEGDEIVYIGDGGSPEASGFSVYAREGEPAPCCNGAVERFVQSGRSTFHCPRCQT
jgi:formamidopyrimidine-DNA glycosylase